MENMSRMQGEFLACDCVLRSPVTDRGAGNGNAWWNLAAEPGLCTGSDVLPAWAYLGPGQCICIFYTELITAERLILKGKTFLVFLCEITYYIQQFPFFPTQKTHSLQSLLRQGGVRGTNQSVAALVFLHCWGIQLISSVVCLQSWHVAVVFAFHQLDTHIYEEKLSSSILPKPGCSNKEIMPSASFHSTV